MKKLLFTALSLALVFTLVACGGEDDEQSETQETDIDTNTDDSDLEQPAPELAEYDANDYPEVVATVEGEDVTNEELVANMEMVQETYAMFGMDVNDAQDEIEETALNQIINTKIVIQKAEEAGLAPSEEELDEEYDLFVSSIEENYEGAEIEEIYSENNLTEEEVREDLRRQWLIASYLEENLEEEAISDEELEEAYDEYVTQSEQVDQEPEDFETIRPSLEQQIQSSQQQRLQQELIDSLREDAEIELFI